ncbi:MAG: UDP-N-acetylmuramoyl-tripeptide--D-alanyl-D-alanine ligase [Desulfonatronovibrio sp.]
MKMTLQEISVALKSVGDLNGYERTEVSSVQTDSRLVRPGDLFICLCGQTMDGHNFAGQAAENGAAAIVSHNPMPGFSVPVMLVEDTLKALGRLGRYWRMKKGGTVIAITGSAGKTTTKEMLSSVLEKKHSVGKNYKNWNNQIGLPLSILEFTGEEEFWVLELGINNPSDMEELGEIVCPDQAVILNVGPCHLQGLGSVQGVARSKAVLLDHLQGLKKAFVCKDYTLLENEVEQRSDINPVWFSCQANPAQYSLSHQGSGHYQMNEDDSSVTFDSMPGGEMYCENIAAVWAVCRQVGLEPDQIVDALKGFSFPEQRFCVQVYGPWTIIDDTYNANPLAMSRAINAARSLAGERDLYLVMGDMAELGNKEASAHQELGRMISRAGCKKVFFHGKNAGNVASGLENGVREDFFEIRNPAHFKTILNDQDCRKGVILFKGSRSSRMERFVGCFLEWNS